MYLSDEQLFLPAPLDRVRGRVEEHFAEVHTVVIDGELNAFCAAEDGSIFHVVYHPAVNESGDKYIATADQLSVSQFMGRVTDLLRLAYE